MPRKAAKAKDQPTTPPASEPATTPEHSPLGASGAERWMNCPGSVALLDALAMPDTDEPEWTAEGTAMHEAAAHLLTTGAETWEIAGQEFHGIVIDAEMGMAIALYVDHVRPLMEDTNTFGVELRAASPETHAQMFGKADLWAIAHRSLIVRDLKGGVGIVVEAYRNPQIMYYSFLTIDHLERERGYVFDDGMLVDLGIVQPRAFHPDGPIRTWETTVGEIKEWVRTTLVPAMDRTAIDNTLTPGEWCRFCPAKLICPMLQGLFEALVKINPAQVINWSDEALDRSYKLLPAAIFAKKAIEEEVFRRANNGVHFESGKLVNKKANRVWKEGASTLAAAEFGEGAFEPAHLKSPPGIEALGPKGKAFVKEYGYTPFTGLTVAPRETDPRQEVKPERSSEVLDELLKKSLDLIASEA